VTGTEIVLSVLEPADVFTHEDGIALPPNLRADQLRRVYQALWHVVDLYEGLWGTPGDAVIEGHVLFAMADTLGIKVPRGQGIDAALEAIDPAVWQQLRDLLTELEAALMVEIFRGDDPAQGWRLRPYGSGYQIIRTWRRNRMDQLERRAAPPWWKRYGRDLLSPVGATGIVLGVLLAELLRHFFGG
jgi:hypothetical protein